MGKEELASVAAPISRGCSRGGVSFSKQHKHTPWGVAGLGAPGEDTELACECTGRAGSLGTEHEPEAFHKEGEKVKVERTREPRGDSVRLLNACKGESVLTGVA